MRAAGQDLPDIARKRSRSRGWQRFMDPARFVFIDETGTATNMARRYGRSPSDRRLVAAMPHGHRRITTLIAGLRQAGIMAPLVTGRADDRDHLPRLRGAMPGAGAPPGDVVVLDNLAATRSTASGGRRGRRLDPLPAAVLARSHPIEQLFAKLKALLRKAATRTLGARIGPLLRAGRRPEYLSPPTRINQKLIN